MGEVCINFTLCNTPVAHSLFVFFFPSSSSLFFFFPLSSSCFFSSLFSSFLLLLPSLLISSFFFFCLSAQGASLEAKKKAFELSKNVASGIADVVHAAEILTTAELTETNVASQTVSLAESITESAAKIEAMEQRPARREVVGVARAAASFVRLAASADLAPMVMAGGGGGDKEEDDE